MDKKKAKMGRPLSNNPRSKSLTIRFTETEMNDIETLSKKAKLTKAEYVRSIVIAGGKENDEIDKKNF